MKHFVFIFLLTFHLPLHGQEKFANQWIVGRSNGSVKGAIIDFNYDTINVYSVNKDMDIETTSASVCNAEGQLALYTNGCYIANGLHQVVENGDSIGGGYLESSYCDNGGAPINQGSIILPSLKSPYLFSVFHLDLGEPYNGNPDYFPLAPESIYHSIIKMDSNSDTVTEKKFLLLQDTFARGSIQATRHSDGKRWWIIIPESHSNCYYTFLFDSNNVSLSIKQCLGEVWDDRDAQGQAVFSPDGKRYVRCNYFNGLNIFDFNTLTGEISNAKSISFGLDTFYFNGAAFSPNSKILYISAYTKLFQFDLQSPDIGSTQQLIAELSTPNGVQHKTFFNKSLLAPDGKIYIGGTNQFKYLHVIEKPNCLGPSCNVNQYAVLLPVFCSFSLPNLPNYFFENDSVPCNNVFVTTPNRTGDIKIQPSPFQEYLHVSLYNSNCNTLFQIFDSIGRCFTTKIIYDGLNEIDTSYWPSGFYIWSVSVNGKGIENGKIIKH